MLPSTLQVHAVLKSPLKNLKDLSRCALSAALPQKREQLPSFLSHDFNQRNASFQWGKNWQKSVFSILVISWLAEKEVRAWRQGDTRPRAFTKSKCVRMLWSFIIIIIIIIITIIDHHHHLFISLRYHIHKLCSSLSVSRKVKRILKLQL